MKHLACKTCDSAFGRLVAKAVHNKELTILREIFCNVCAELFLFIIDTHKKSEETQ